METLIQDIRYGVRLLLKNRSFTVDQDQPISNVKTMAQRIDEAMAQRRFNMLLLGIFAVVALV